MSVVKVGGIDPGPRPGLVLLHVEDNRLLRIERGPHLSPELVVEASDYVALEAYVRGRASVRGQDARAQLVTQQMAAAVKAECDRLGRVYQALPAGAVKPWATDDRLRSYEASEGQAVLSLYALTRGGGGHDRDAARHALNLAVKLGMLPKR